MILIGIYLLPRSRSSNLPTRGTRLLNRSRVQGVLASCPDSPRSLVEPIPRPRRSSSLTKTPSPLQVNTTIAKGTAVSSSTTTDDLTIDRSTRNSMIQDVLYFKKQLLRLRRLLQEVCNSKSYVEKVLILFPINFNSPLILFLFLFYVPCVEWWLIH